MNDAPIAWIRALGLRPHPEGGSYREIYRSTEVIARTALPPRFGGDRALSTSIYYLLNAGERSLFHRLRADEIWHFYDGTGLILHRLTADGRADSLRLGRSLERGEAFQAVVRAGDWFGAEPDPSGGWALAGCTLAPGFEFEDFELARREDLLARYPGSDGIIRRLTRVRPPC